MSSHINGKESSSRDLAHHQEQGRTPTTGDKSLSWQPQQSSQNSMTGDRGSSRGDTRLGEKKAQHRFSKNVPDSKSFGMERFMQESQGPRGTAPWVPVWSFPKSGGGQKKAS